MSHDPKEALDFVNPDHLTTAVGYDQEDRGWSKMAQLEAEQESLRLHLSAALRLHGTRQDWPTLSDAVQDAAGVIRANRKTLNELHQILGTEPHESILDRARAVMAALHFLPIYVHAHGTGNSVPPMMDREARAALVVVRRALRGGETS